MMRRMVSVSVFALALVLMVPAVALACGGLIAPGHAEVLRKATTLAAWHDGFEHYVTGFQFAGSANKFGYIIPLPGVPTKIQKAGDWTLERLDQEVNPVERFALQAVAGAASKDVDVLQRVKVEAMILVHHGNLGQAALQLGRSLDMIGQTQHACRERRVRGSRRAASPPPRTIPADGSIRVIPEL
jgi:hypothetical protein